MKRINLFFDNLSEKYEEYLFLNHPYIWNRNYIQKWRYIAIVTYSEIILILISSIIYLIIPENWNVDKSDFFAALLLLSLFSYIFPAASAQYPSQFIKRESDYPGIFIERNEHIRLAATWVTYLGYFFPLIIFFIYFHIFIGSLRNISLFFLFCSLVSSIRTALDYFNPPHEHGETVGRFINKAIAPIFEFLKRYKLIFLLIIVFHLIWILHDLTIYYKFLPFIIEIDNIKKAVWVYYNHFLQFIGIISVYLFRLFFYFHLIIFVVMYALYFPKAKRNVLNRLHAPR